MSLFEWIVVVAVIWLAVATVVGVLVGRAIRIRDRQVPSRLPSPRAGRRGRRAGPGPAGITKPSATSHGRSGDHRD